MPRPLPQFGQCEIWLAVQVNTAMDNTGLASRFQPLAFSPIRYPHGEYSLVFRKSQYIPENEEGIFCEEKNFMLNKNDSIYVQLYVQGNKEGRIIIKGVELIFINKKYYKF